MDLSKNDKKEAYNLMELWEDDLLERYPEEKTKAKEEFRNYATTTRDTVREFYKANHEFQTYDFVRLSNERLDSEVWANHSCGCGGTTFIP